MAVRRRALRKRMHAPCRPTSTRPPRSTSTPRVQTPTTPTPPLSGGYSTTLGRVRGADRGAVGPGASRAPCNALNIPIRLVPSYLLCERRLFDGECRLMLAACGVPSGYVCPGGDEEVRIRYRRRRRRRR